MSNTPCRITLIGNPNSGKSTLFNALTGAKQKIGNWPGVTVEKRTGEFSHANQSFLITDLPGIYHLTHNQSTQSLDAKIADNYLKQHHDELIINIVDASNLERQLYLTVQLLEMGRPVIVALNMMDIAKQKQLTINIEQLSTTLNCPVIPLICRKKQGLQQLKKHLMTAIPPANIDLAYPDEIEAAIKTLTQTRDPAPSSLSSRYQALCDIEAHAYQRQSKVDSSPLLLNDDTDLHIGDARFSFIANALALCSASKTDAQHKLTAYLDKLFLNRWLGIPIFLMVMYLLFEVSITLGGALQPLFDDGSRALFINGINHVGHLLALPNWLSAIFADGIGLGINTVLTFVPQIGAMFLCLSFLETSGYMSRAAFVVDRFMQWIGLPGKSFVPLIIGFGCNVPAIMATRTLDTEKDRLITIMMSPFISCGARLAIFVVFSSAFFPKGGALIIFILYLFGVIIAVLTGLIISKTLLKGEHSPSLMELPSYHIPHLPSILKSTWHRLKRFIFRAGKVIVPVCMLVGALNIIDFHGNIHEQGSRQSILSSVSRTITPVFAPMGITDKNWPATVGLITGGLAKEVVVGTLNTLYSQQYASRNTQTGYNLKQGLNDALYNTYQQIKALPSALFANPFSANEAEHDMSDATMGNMVMAFGSTTSAFCYLLFVLLYVPCVSTIAVTAKEGSRKWAMLSTLWSLCVAYTLSVIVYQCLTFTQHPGTSILWITLNTLGLLGFVVALHYVALNTKSRRSKRVIPIYPKKEHDHG